MDLGLKGLNVLVTGGSKGIGRHCADIFAARARTSRSARATAEEVTGLRSRR
jgi:3-oxoacyl-[acyl-carrier protein] reductase